MPCQRSTRAAEERSGVSDSGPSITARIVTAVAEEKGIDPVSLDAQLYEAVDPDALASLVTTDTDSRLTVSFNYAGYRVTVIAEDDITVDTAPLA